MPVACQRRAKTGTAEMTREISNVNADPSLLGTQLGRAGAVLMITAMTKAKMMTTTATVATRIRRVLDVAQHDGVVAVVVNAVIAVVVVAVGVPTVCGAPAARRNTVCLGVRLATHLQDLVTHGASSVDTASATTWEREFGRNSCMNRDVTRKLNLK